MLTFHIISLFPGTLDSYLSESIIGRAVKNKKIKIKFYNPRDFIKSKNKSGYKPVDARAYGGGPGMVLQAGPILRAVEKARSRCQNTKPKIILFTPEGKQFDNQAGIKLAQKFTDIILICGRYEGIDARVKKILKAEAVSVGPYVLTGGELPAMIVLDTVARQVEGVLGKFNSLEEKRTASAETYTRPEILKYRGKNYRVPKILLSGHHAAIEKWRGEKR